jgi:hypothetical protein
MGVSFFSVDNYQGSTPLMAGIQRDVKLYDIEEVPVYTASDVNKFLTVMSDGSLRWLGLSESYIVELIGGGGDTGNAAGLEDNVSLQLFGGATVDGGVLNAPNAGDYATLPHAAEYEIAEAKTFSMWFKTSDLTALDFDDNYTLISKWRHSDRSGYILSIGKGVDSKNTVQNYMNNNGWGTNGYVRFIACNPASTHSIDSSTFYKLNKNVEDNQWHHIVFQIDNVAVGVQPVTRVFLDGVLLSESVGSRNSGSTLQLPAANGWLTDNFYVEQSTPTIPLNIAAHSYSPGFRTFRGSLDGVSIDSGIMTDSQISDLFNAGRVTPEQPAAPVGIALNQIEDDTENYGLWYGMTRNLSEGTIVKGSRTDGMLRSLGSSVDLGVRQDTTFTMWLKTGTHSGATELIKWGGWSDTLHKGLYVEHDTRTTISGISSANNAILSGYTDGHIKIKVFDQLKTSSNWYQYTSFFKMPKNIRDNQWHQVVVQFSNVGSGLGNSYAKVYVDGVKITECFRGNDRVGSGADGSLQLRGNIIDTQGSVYVTCTRGFPQGSEFDNITIQNEILTDQDVVDSYNTGRI